MQQGRRRFKREKRFLLLMPEYVLGGAETQFRYMIEYADKHRWNLDVLVEHRFCGSSTLFKADARRMKNVRFFEVDKQGSNGGKMHPCVMRHLIKKFSCTKYEACLIYYPQYLTLVPVFKALGMRIVYSERKDAAYILDNSCMIKNIKRCDWVLANARSTQRKLEEKLGLEVHLINNGKPVVEQLAMKENRQIRRILVAARVNQSKNQMMVLRFLRDYPDFQGKIIFAGRADNKMYKRELLDFGRKNNLNDRVQFLGYVANMREEYDKADIVLLPSLAEGTSNVVLEAYGYGRPVIVSDIEAERDIVRNPALRFGLNDASGIDRCIKYVENLSNEEYCALLEDNRKFVLENYDIEKMAKKFHQFLSREM